MQKTWLITGVSGGLGLALAHSAACSGHAVIGTVRREGDRAAFEQRIPGARAILLDLADPGSVADRIHDVEAGHGPIDVLVNNAGQGFTGAIEETGLDQVRQLLEINLIGPLALIQAVLPSMRARRSGHIINVTSISAFQPWSGTGAYCATKFALDGLGLTLAQELKPFGIRVTNVMPGGLRTGFNGAIGRAVDHIEDYAESAHFAAQALRRSDGRQAGDPAAAADRIVQMVEAAVSPVSFVLGSDAVSMANQRMGQMLEDIGRWASLSSSIDFDGPAPFLRH